MGGGHSSSSGSGVTTIHQTGLPPPGTVSDAQLVQMLRGFPVAVLKEWLQEEGEWLCGCGCGGGVCVFVCLCIGYGQVETDGRLTAGAG